MLVEEIEDKILKAMEGGKATAPHFLRALVELALTTIRLQVREDEVDSINELATKIADVLPDNVNAEIPITALLLVLYSGINKGE